MTTPATLPAPLTPPDCDLQDFKFMPLDVARLRDSDMASEQTPEENWAAVMLWAAAWHQVPAGSMPDSDNWIAKAAGYLSRGRIDPHWKDVREGAMRGFVLCSDGRWYHTVVCEKANESWIGKLKQRLKTECARIKKHNDRHQTRIPFPEFDAWFAAGCPTGQPLPVPKDIAPMSRGTDDDVPDDTPPLSLDDLPDVPTQTPSKGQGEGQGELTTKPESSSQASTVVGANDVGDEDGLRPALPTARNGQIALLLRAQGVQATSQNPIVAVTWAQNPKVTDEVLNVAIAKAKGAKPGEVIPLRYLLRIVDQELEAQAAPPPAAAAQKPRDDWTWKKSNQGIEAKGREYGMFARSSESYMDFASRIQAEIDKRKGKAA
jgi:hypothetical protein